MITNLNEWKKHLESKGLIKEGKLSEEFDGEYDDADFVPATEDGESEENSEESEENEDGVTFEEFKDAIVAEHEKMCMSDDDEESEEEESDDDDDDDDDDSDDKKCEMLDEDQLLIAYNVCLSFCSGAPEESDEEDEEDEEEEINGEEVEEMEEALENIKVPNKKQINEIFGKKKDKKDGGKSAYKNTVEFIEGDSEEAKKVKKYYNEYLKGKTDQEIRKDSKLLKVMQMITKLGAKWAKENKMEPKDYSFKQIRTVLEGDYDRAFTGGTDVVTGESKKSEDK